MKCPKCGAEMKRVGVWGGHKPDKPGWERITEWWHLEETDCTVKAIQILEEG